MTRSLLVRNVGPGVAVQDLGRPGFLAYGLTKGGAADPLALYEGAALLGQDPNCAALEMVGLGGSFEATADTRIALTGAEMKADIDGATIVWNACHALPKGAILNIGGTRKGVFGYLHVGGGFDTPLYMGTRGSHLSAGLGSLVAAGNELPIAPDKGGETGLILPRDNRFGGGTLRVAPSMQTHAFSDDMRQRFTQTTFKRDPRANRQGVRMDCEGRGFQAENQLGIVSEVIVPGDIQIPGDGRPFVLMSESQTTGGYPRMGTVLATDLPCVAQAQTGADIRFEFVTLDDARAIETRETIRRLGLRRTVQPLLRDPAKIADLLGYQLISGATAGHD
ncbi:biotin-dependent carboxyltransferase family protein [Ascidiaceihabitans sp.]|uniref:5-oxoprolinase subunit C family protein n=1 Tax=Ascidiaceihabitans sp. TaxID=1872644 RepID=UPI0032997F52